MDLQVSWDGEILSLEWITILVDLFIELFIILQLYSCRVPSKGNKISTTSSSTATTACDTSPRILAVSLPPTPIPPQNC